MFRAAYRSSSGALTLSAAFGLYTHVVTGYCPGWVGTGKLPPSLDNGRLELLIMSGMPLETC